MTRAKLIGLLATVIAGSLFGAAPAAAQTTNTPTFFNCRASAVYASVAGNDRVEPVVANGNPNTGEGRSPDFALCAKADSGAGSVATQLAIPNDFLRARTASARTDVAPVIAQSADQTVIASAAVEDLALPLGGETIALGVGAARSDAVATCVNGAPSLTGASRLTEVTLGGTPITLDQLVDGLATALAPLGPIVDIKVNEQVRDGTSLTVRALRVTVLRDVGADPLIDLIVAESKVTAPANVCTRVGGPGGPGGPGTDADGNPIRPCPQGSTLRPQDGVCVIAGQGTNGSDIVIGLPFQGPSGGRVISLAEARRDARFRNSPCVRAPGRPLFVTVGTNGNDRITGTNARDRILGLSGNDSIAGGRGDDCLDGGNGRDALSGGIGADRIFGMAGNDALNGGSQNDRLSGGSGNDTINAGFGADRVFAGPGNDAVNVATAGRKARVSCGPGRDTVRFNNEEARFIRRDCERRIGLPDRPRR